MEYTENYNLKKPEGTDIYDIGNENDNMDIIDAQLQGNAGSISNLNTNKAEKTAVANKADITNINITSGTTNNTGATITAGKYFYYNGALVKAKADIADGATLTFNTNYESAYMGDDVATIKSSLASKIETETISVTTVSNGDAVLGLKAGYILLTAIPSACYFCGINVSSSSGSYHGLFKTAAGAAHVGTFNAVLVWLKV